MPVTWSVIVYPVAVAQVKAVVAVEMGAMRVGWGEGHLLKYAPKFSGVTQFPPESHVKSGNIY